MLEYWQRRVIGPRSLQLILGSQDVHVSGGANLISARPGILRVCPYAVGFNGKLILAAATPVPRPAPLIQSLNPCAVFADKRLTGQALPL